MLSRIFVVSALLVIVSAYLPHEQESQNLFIKFVKQHGKSYDVEEMFHRYGIFKSNHAFIEKHNAMNKGFKLAINKFADLTNQEYRAMLGLKRGPKRQAPEFHVSDVRVPDSIDWVQRGACNPPKDQGQCGSCWTFSARASMETTWFLKSGRLLSLSEQLCLDCVNNGQNDCSTGGEMHDCYLQVIAFGADELESVYPYTATSLGVCHFNNATSIPTPFSSYVQAVNCTSDDNSTYYCNENDLKSAAALTVVSVAIDASQQSFQFYSSGVYDEPACNSCDNLDHGVAVAGYGTEGGQDYWLVRNSWGADWGLQGYIKMSRNKNNQCGIACDATYPI